MRKFVFLSIFFTPPKKSLNENEKENVNKNKNKNLSLSYQRERIKKLLSSLTTVCKFL